MSTKQCAKCKETKDLEKFAYHRSNKDKKSSWCRDCFSTYNKNKRVEVVAYIEFIKQNNNCPYCGEEAPECLDFHHVTDTGDNKRIHKLRQQGRLKAIKKELKKCIVVCSNCHRKIHSGRIEVDGHKKPILIYKQY